MVRNFYSEKFCPASPLRLDPVINTVTYNTAVSCAAKAMFTDTVSA
jgi:hypothetical protein